MFLLLYGGRAVGQYDFSFMDLTPSLVDLSRQKGWDKFGYYAREGAYNKYIVRSEAPCYLFINGQLIREIASVDTLCLRELKKYSASKELLLIFLGKELHSGFQFGREVKGRGIVKQEYPIYKRPKGLDGQKDFILFGGVLILLLFGLLFFIYRERVLFIFYKPFTVRSNVPWGSFFSIANISLVVFLALVVSYVGICLFYKGEECFERYLFFWAEWAVFVVGIFILKKYFVYFMASLFQFNNQKKSQVFDFINFSFLVFSSLFFVIVLDYILGVSFASWVATHFILILLVVYFLFAIWEGNKILYQLLKNKLPIIIYICATELVPTLILVKLVQ